METVYVDTSVLARVLLDEPDAEAAVHELAAFERQVSSRLLGIELRRVALQHGLAEEAGAMLADISLLPLDDAILETAATVLPADVATLDAIHLATATRLARDGELDALMTYDAQLAAGAEHHGIRVIAPAG